ncbi:MAG: TonB-dependent receptor plug domain-containing protein, partial [Gammaproteobacteria bacterium]
MSASGLQTASAAEGLDEVVVTGSRIKRENIESAALPVTVITREQLDESGDTSVADFIRDLPFNSFGSLRQQSGNSGQSFAGISLRGLGEGRTLVLVDGRRAPVAPNVGSAQDLNSIPLAAVERIEVITNGASAIYGSDAIGGVVTIITRKDFNGVQAVVGASDPRRSGGATEEGSLIFGASGDRGSLLAGVSYNHRDIIFQRDRSYSSVPGASTFSNNFLSSRVAPGTLYGFAAVSFLANPTFGSVVPGGCTERGFYTSGTGASQRCFYNFALEGAYEAEV